jgi:para-nitrobenzyl esterase
MRQPLARIESGQVSGMVMGEQKEIHVYRGIPFAAQPLGDLRWKPPQPVKAWDGVRACTEFGPACPQPKVFLLSNDINRLGEGCLNLNVWAPAQRSGKGLPVMVWIHGGAYVMGANYQTWFNGESLARKGVVVVTVNYRLGLLGFLAHPLLSRESQHGVSGNYGLLDQIAALKWVRRNIAAFGGDPGCVTVFGESAGAGSVCHLLVSPLAKGLFHRAIAESGGARGPARHLHEKWYGKEPMEAVGAYVAKTLGCDRAENPLIALRAKSAAEILKAADSAKWHFGDEISAPVVDGWVLPDDPGLRFDEGKTHDVPFLVGSNADEAGGIVGDFAVRGLYREYADAILKLFPAGARKRAGTVAIFTSVARADARAMSRHKSKAYLYQFTRVAPPWRFLGAFHASEIAYVFGNLDAKLSFEPRDWGLSHTMMAYWVQFARNGDPNGEGLPNWPAYDARTDMHLELGDVVRTGKGLDKIACDGIDRIRAQRTSKRKGP